MKKTTYFFAMLIVMMIQPVLLHAEDVYGRVVGRDGFGLPDATVNVTVEGNPMEWTTLTDGNGDYRISGLADGKTTITFELSDFTTITRAVGQQDRVDVALSPAEEETIVVTNEFPLLMDRKQIEFEIDINEIPTRRDPWSLLNNVTPNQMIRAAWPNALADLAPQYIPNLSSTSLPMNTVFNGDSYDFNLFADSNAILAIQNSSNTLLFTPDFTIVPVDSFGKLTPAVVDAGLPNLSLAQGTDPCFLVPQPAKGTSANYLFLITDYSTIPPTGITVDVIDTFVSSEEDEQAGTTIETYRRQENFELDKSNSVLNNIDIKITRQLAQSPGGIVRLKETQEVTTFFNGQKIEEFAVEILPSNPPADIQGGDLFCTNEVVVAAGGEAAITRQNKVPNNDRTEDTDTLAPDLIWFAGAGTVTRAERIVDILEHVHIGTDREYTVTEQNRADGHVERQAVWGVDPATQELRLERILIRQP